ncbi:MAG: extracellular solute-binding protein [Acidisphaera sp.]|nr:extracellular solute-binding protein [Acidisphaera sp.]
MLGNLAPTRRTVLATALAVPFVGPASAAPATIELTSWQTEEPGFATWWKEVVDAYNATNPARSVAMTGIPFANYLDQLTIRFAANRPPALLELPSDNVGAFASQGWLEPLDARIKGTPIETEWSSLQKDLVWDGKVQGVLLMGYAFMMFYNDKLLADAGVAVPANWADWLAAVPKITRRNDGIFGVSAVTTEYPTIPLDLLRNIVWSGQSFIEGERYNLTDKAVIADVERYRSVTGANAPPGSNSTIIRQLFVDGRTGFLVDGPWVYTLLAKATAETRPHLKMAKAPFAPPIGGASNSLHLAAGLDRATADAAWSFVLFTTQPQWQTRYTELSNCPSPRRNALSSQMAQAHPELVTINDAVVGAIPAVPDNQGLRSNWVEANKILQRASVQVLSTQTPVADILRQTQAELERAAPLG